MASSNRSPCANTAAVPLKRYPLREMGSTKLTSVAGFWRRFSTVRGERTSAKIRRSSSQAAVVPFGERLGVPSRQTVATKPRRRCSSTIRLMSSPIVPIPFLLQTSGLAHRRHTSPIGLRMGAAPLVFVPVVAHPVLLPEVPAQGPLLLGTARRRAHEDADLAGIRVDRHLGLHHGGARGVDELVRPFPAGGEGRRVVSILAEPFPV